MNFFDAIQIPYIQIANILQKATSRIPEKAKNRLLTFCFVLLAVFYLLEYCRITRFFMDNANLKGGFVLLMILLIAAFSTDGQANKLELNKAAVIIYYLYIISILFARIFHPLRDGWVMFAVSLIIMPVLFIVWGNRNCYESMFIRISDVWMKTGLLFYILSFISLPPDGWHFYLGRYSGLTTSPNYIGMLSVSTLAAALYLLMKEKQIFLSLMTAGVSLAEVWLSGSRASFLADAAIIIIYVVMIIRRKDDKRAEKGRARDRINAMLLMSISIMIGIACATAAPFPAENLGFQGISALRDITDSGDKFTDEELMQQGIEIPGSTSDLGEIIVSLFAEKVYAESETGMDSGTADTADDNQTSSVLGRTLDPQNGEDLSNGRIEVYTQVLEQINLTGHDPVENQLYYTSPVLGKAVVPAAHNAPLDYTFVCGLPAGLLCLALELAAALFVITYVFLKKERPAGAAFAAMIITGYGIEAMLDIQLIMGNRALVLLFFLAFSMIAVNPSKEDL